MTTIIQVYIGVWKSRREWTKRILISVLIVDLEYWKHNKETCNKVLLVLIILRFESETNNVF